MIKRYLLSLLGYHDWPDDLENEVPDHIGIGGPVAETDGSYWYLLATYGTGDDHQHIEIKLDVQQLGALMMQAEDRVNELRGLSDETPSGDPIHPAPAAPSAEPGA